MVSSKNQTVLVTGASGTVGSEVVRYLLDATQDEPVEVRALTRTPGSADLPDAVTPVGGELTDVDAMREALDGVDGVFLLSPVSMEELTGTLLTLDLIHQARTPAIVYLSVIHADRFTDPPHFAAKAAAERMIAEFDLPATSLRPGYYMQNDLRERARLQDGVYAPPLGSAGVLGVDVRDLGEVGARSLLRRLRGHQAPDVLDVVAPQPLTGESVAATWSELLGRTVAYGGDDLDGTEEALREAMPPWLARDMRLMFARFERDGMVAAPGTDEALVSLLGRPMRSYREFAADAARGWS